MTQTRPRLVSEASVSRRAAMTAASVLIFLGIVFQLGELGYGQLGAGNLWFARMIAVNIWDLIAMHLNSPSLMLVLKFWPLALVGIGLAMLAAHRAETRAGALHSSRDGEKPLA